jgi:hypothetical protein
MLTPSAAIVQRHDPERFVTVLFAPEAARETLFTLYAFNHELARAREVASMPTLALIRLQWWREVVDGAQRGHEVATPLHEAIANGRLDPAALHSMIDARMLEAEECVDENAWADYLRRHADARGRPVARRCGLRRSPYAMRRRLWCGRPAAQRLRLSSRRPMDHAGRARPRLGARTSLNLAGRKARLAGPRHPCGPAGALGTSPPGKGRRPRSLGQARTVARSPARRLLAPVMPRDPEPPRTEMARHEHPAGARARTRAIGNTASQCGGRCGEQEQAEKIAHGLQSITLFQPRQRLDCAQLHPV